MPVSGSPLPASLNVSMWWSGLHCLLLYIPRIRKTCPKNAKVKRLLAQPEAIEQGAITVPIGTTQVVKQFPATTYHSQQPATGVMVLDVILEMPGQVVAARGQQCDLHFRRAGVGLRTLMILQDLSLLARRNRHCSSPK